MKEKIKLLNPIKINGKQVEEMTCDCEEITAEQFGLAANRAHALTQKNASMQMNFMESDTTFHMYIGFMGIIACDNSIDITDLERLRGSDVIRITRLGRSFIGRSASVDRKMSEEQSEDFRESTIAESET